MKVNSKEVSRFQDLIYAGRSVLNTKYTAGAGSSITYYTVDSSLSYKWGMQCLSTLESVCGKNNMHFIEFNELFKGFDSIEGYSCAKKALAVLEATKDAYENGYIIADTQEQNQRANEGGVDKNKENIKEKCDQEAERSTRIYLIAILMFLVFTSSAFFLFLGVQFATFLTVAILFLSYIMSVVFLKEWTPAKLHERLLEYEKKRMYKTFDL